MSREFSVVIERDEDGYLVASVPSLPGCHTQARSPVVPVHAGETIGAGLLSKILRDCRLDREQFRNLL
jgi:hypothetical protein